MSLCNIENIYTVINSIIENKVPANTYNISDPQEYLYTQLLRYQQAKNIIPIPKILIRCAYLFGYIIKNTFIIYII